MRTTITLDEDVAARLAAYMRKHGVGLKAAVNTLLRRAFEVPGRPERPAFSALVFDLGQPAAGLDLDRVGETLEVLEGPRYR